MPSNVRGYDNSCQNTRADKVKFYKCSTCKPGEILHICEECKNGAQHNHHRLKAVSHTNLQTFCNCGDASGLFSCANHSRVKLSKYEKPLHVNKTQMTIFVNEFGLDLDDFTPIASLNQIRKLHYKSTDGIMITNYFDNSNIRSKGNIKIIKTWSVYRKDAEQNFVAKGYDQERRLLLWHGTATKNLMGILENGFRKPKNPRNVANGSMFGDGVYFADRVSKSALFCDKPGRGLLFLCEVSLGSMWRTGLPKNHTQPPQNFQSIKGVGKNVPDKNGEETFHGNIIVPAGRTIPHPHPKIGFSQINYNEYLVFDPDRILIKFIVEIYRQ